MKKCIRSLALATILTLGLSTAQAGIGLSVGAVNNLAQGNILASAIGAGFGAASIVHGTNLVQRGHIGWGVFFLVLAEQKVISDSDVAILEGLDTASKEAFLEIISSDESEETKRELLGALFQ